MTTVTRRSLLIGGVALATAGAGFPALDDPSPSASLPATPVPTASCCGRRTRTAPESWVLGQDLTMCFASCAHFGEGCFTAYRRLAEDHPDVVLHLGDYQYEHAAKAADVRISARCRTCGRPGPRPRR